MHLIRSEVRRIKNGIKGVQFSKIPKWMIFVIMHVLFLLLLFAIANIYVEAVCQKSPTRVSGTHAPVKKEFCAGELIFEDDFDKLDATKWQHENTLAGGGNWQFQWYTNNRSNSYTENGILKIRPTLTADQLGEAALNSATLDINGATPNECTDPQWWGCLRTATPDRILNPIKSAGLRSLNSFSFCYGRVEIRAKLPKGDWLWPAFWLLPKHAQYGLWPASGEIDIFESRGNTKLIENGINIGVEQVASTLHWGPDFARDQFFKTLGTKNSKDDFGSNFHIYEMVWSNTNITFSVDRKQIITISPPAGGFWQIGQFNLPERENPWRGGSKMAPFDEEFFFVINMAVGGVSGYFPDHAANPSGKPWSNMSPRATTDFWNGRSRWLPTWDTQGDNSALQVDYIRVYAI